MFKLVVVLYVLTVNGPIGFGFKHVGTFETKDACASAAPLALEGAKPEFAANLPAGTPFLLRAACPEAEPVNPNTPGRPA